MSESRRSNKTSAVGLNERAQRLLKALVESYIRDGQPVGSKVLARDSGLDVSSATVRNILAELDDLGLISSPHTSAGRVPTSKGYRVFVDSLLTFRQPARRDLARLRAELDGKETTEDLVDSVSSALSELTKLTGVVMVPRRDYTSLTRIEFLRLGEKRVLAILVIDEREVQNRVLHTARDFTESELHQAANYLNELFAGKDLRAVRTTLLNELKRAKDQVNALMQTAIEMAGQVFERTHTEPDVVMAGQTNLMHFAELSNLDKLRRLFEAFNQKRDVLHLLDECFMAQSMQIFIGEESGHQVFDECSVITAPYEADGRVLGVLGVIGPTRLQYEKVIPLVDVTAKLLGSLLNSRD